jgi:sulfite exporter TauE/SafE
MNIEYAIPALVLGLGGSLHCVGMCGPLMFSTLLNRNGAQISTQQFLLYHLGRIGIYAAWGLLFGLIGTSAKWFGLQQNISLSMGIAILVVLVLIQVFPGIENKLSRNPLSKAIGKKMVPYLHAKMPSSAFMGGLLNGMLPCGLVYVALAGASAAQDPIRGSLFMAFFGMGTLPLLAALLVLGKGLQMTIRKSLTRWYPLMIGGMAMMLILRGLDKGNMLSPSLLPGKNAAVHCAAE